MGKKGLAAHERQEKKETQRERGTEVLVLADECTKKRLLDCCFFVKTLIESTLLCLLTV